MAELFYIIIIILRVKLTNLKWRGISHISAALDASTFRGKRSGFNVCDDFGWSCWSAYLSVECFPFVELKRWLSTKMSFDGMSDTLRRVFQAFRKAEPPPSRVSRRRRRDKRRRVGATRVPYRVTLYGYIIITALFRHIEQLLFLANASHMFGIFSQQTLISLTLPNNESRFPKISKTFISFIRVLCCTLCVMKFSEMCFAFVAIAWAWHVLL